MANPIQKLFLPLYRLTHWPDPHTYYQGTYWEVDQMMDRHGVGRDRHRVVLEIGCGDGRTSLKLAQRFHRVIGLEMNANRLKARPTEQVRFIVGDAEQLPLAPQSVDVILSVAVFEHLANPDTTMRRLAQCLRPGGVMIHAMPHWPWKLLQFVLFFPDKLRKHVRGVTRWLAGQRTTRKTEKFIAGSEANNLRRVSRRRWYHAFTPRVHGEYDSHLEETLAWTDRQWIKLYDQAGLRVVDVMAGGFHSPYAFGFKPLARLGGKLGLGAAKFWLVAPQEASAGNPSRRERDHPGLPASTKPVMAPRDPAVQGVPH